MKLDNHSPDSLEKYTVIIPTRDRCETLGPAIRTCLEQKHKGFEIIVCDNFSTDKTSEVVQNYKDSRLKYFRTTNRLSMADNFEFALNLVDDGFVMFIGDDDGLLPDSVEYAARLQRTTGLLAISGSNSEYCWPSFPDSTRANSIKWLTGYESSEIRCSKYWRQRCLNFLDSYTFEMPKLYHGFVHKQIIDQAKSHGRFFNSITPDAYAAFAVSFFVDEYVYSHRPFTIGGASGRSNGVSALDGNGKGDEAQKFLMENNIEFHHELDFCPSLEVNMAEAFMQFSQRFPERTASYLPDWEVMLHSALDSANPRTYMEVARAVASMAEKHCIDLDQPCFRYRLRKLRRFWSSLKKFTRSTLEGNRLKDVSSLGVHDVYDASQLIHRVIKEKSL